MPTHIIASRKDEIQGKEAENQRKEAEISFKAWELLEEYVCDQESALVDVSQSGKMRPWNEKAENKGKVAHLFDLLGMHFRGDKIHNCGSWLKFLQCKNDPENHPKTLADARFCKDPFCDMCAWRRSMKYSQQLDQLLTAVNTKRRGLAWVFLTLTVRNVSCQPNGYVKNEDTNELRQALDEMMESWNRFAKDRQFKKRVIGWIRSLEVTVNNDVNDKEWYGTYHPHFHVLMCVERSRYFKRGTELYMEQGDWIKLWRRCAKLDYDPRVHVEKVKRIQTFKEMSEVSAQKLKTIKSPVLEVAKYPLKMADIFTDAKYRKLKSGKKKRVASWDVDELTAKGRLWDLSVALRKRRMLAFGGLIKKVRQELKQRDLDSEKVDLIHTDEENHEVTKCTCPVCGAIRQIWLYRLTQDGYIHGGSDYYIRKEKFKARAKKQATAKDIKEVDTSNFYKGQPAEEKKKVTAFDMDRERAEKFFEDGGKVDWNE